jgi:hypothetical protein
MIKIVHAELYVNNDFVSTNYFNGLTTLTNAPKLTGGGAGLTLIKSNIELAKYIVNDYDTGAIISTDIYAIAKSVAVQKQLPTGNFSNRDNSWLYKVSITNITSLHIKAISTAGYGAAPIPLGTKISLYKKGVL